MELSEFNALVGQDSYVRCVGKIRNDTAIVSEKAAKAHIYSGGQIGWWVKSGYIVVDIDEGRDVALKVIKRLGLKTLMCKTPKGLHLYFKTDDDFPQKVGMVLPCGLKCDFRCANKGYVLLPFNSEGRTFNKVHKIANLPIEFTPIMNRKESLLGLREGDGRNATLFAHLMAFKNRGADQDTVELMAEVINELVFEDSMAEDELEKVLKNTRKYAAAEQGDNPYLIYNSKGVPTKINSRAICDYFVNRGDIFVLGGEAYQYINGVYTEASSFVRNTIKDMIMLDAFIDQSRIMEAFRLLTDDTRIKREAASLNREKNLINFQNGVWDLDTKKLLPHDSKYLQTLQLPHEIGRYVPFKQTKLYDFFMKTGLPKEDLQMILKFMAYTMTTSFGLKTFLILCGQSNTGKSVLIRFFDTLVGKENTSALSMHELNMRFYPAQLYSKLLNSCGDNSSAALNSIDLLKKITGGDEIMHEKKGKEPFFFVPFCKLVFSFNQLPLQLEEKSNAFYRRIRIVYMNRELYLNDDYVNELCSPESISETIPYLLSLLPLDDIPRTETSNRYVESLRQDSDSIHAFLTNYCHKEENSFIPRSQLYDEYYKFCMENGREGHKKHTFMRNLRSLGYREIRDKKSREYCFCDISFNQSLLR